MEEEVSPVVDTIKLKQDIGGPFPAYKVVILDLHKDGSVTWRDVVYDS